MHIVDAADEQIQLQIAIQIIHVTMRRMYVSVRLFLR